MAGLSSDGLTIKRLPEIIDEITTSERNNISSNISTEDDEVLGQLNNIIGTSLAELWELVESVNDNFNVDKAEGRNLDDLAALVGISRIAALKTTGSARFTGVDGSVVPLGALAQNPVSLDRFLTTEVVNIQATACYAATITPAQVLDSTLYRLTINTTDYDFTTTGSATDVQIIQGLQGLIAVDTAATWIATLNTESTLLTITTDDPNDISIITTTLLTADSVTVDGSIEAEIAGAVIAPPNSVISVVSSVAGWDEVTNPEALTAGRAEELDEELRLRIRVSQQINGLSTVDAIEDVVSTVAGVSSVQVIENVTLVTDAFGRPAKSFETLVDGGTDLDVAQAIWVSKAAGIATYGGLSVSVIDSKGRQRDVNFSRPEDIYLAFRITYSLYDEETFPTEGEQAIKDAVVATTSLLQLDEDVIPSRYYGPIYNAVSGIDSLTVEVQALVNQGDTPSGGSWQTTKLAISFNGRGTTVDTDITIVAV